MGKLVVLKLGKGHFEQGFPVTLQIGDEGAPPAIETTGELPPAPEIPVCYTQWQQIYRRLDLSGRPIGLPKVVTPKATIADCEAAAHQLRDRLNDWLDARSFRPVREKWLEQLDPNEIIRLVVQTDDAQLRRLPWHLWDLMERYPYTEIALSLLEFHKRPTRPISLTPQVRILAILGNSQNIDIQKDRAILEQLTDAKVTFLVEPARQDLSDRLWEQSWEILFFAGHSTSQSEDNSGLIHLNQTETLTISQLKHGLEKAMERGLKLAIFNSCDGLGLARELAYLQIPQLIVMREPVPDRVAQEFLKYFLAAYAEGEPLYLAVRSARSRLQGLEGEFPCATWLPVICQHPAEIPPTWQQLKGAVEQSGAAKKPSATQRSIDSPPLSFRRSLPWLFAISLLTTGLVTGVRYAGLLQSAELKALDLGLQMRPKEPRDPRLLVVEVTEKDIQAQAKQDPSKPADVSLSSRSLAQLLDKLEPLQPSVIGLDLYRDPVGKEFPQLAERMKNSDRLIAVCFRADPNSNRPDVAPPPEIPTEQAIARLGFSNVLTDPDGIVRRHLLSMDGTQACPAQYAFSTQLALHYLAQQNINLEFKSDGTWKLGKALIRPIEFPTGGYFNLDGRGHQILLNYRSRKNRSSFSSLAEVVDRISLGTVLSGNLTPESVKDRIVLIGTTAHTASFQDYFTTPYTREPGGQDIPGVMLHAQMVSQLLSAALESRPLLWTGALWTETLWIGAWSLLGALLALYLRHFAVLSVASGTAIATLFGICLVLLVQFGWWVPLLPTAIATLSSTGVVFISRSWIAR
ncbi:CHASE2 domain-containing protein [Phormidium sp. CLA17]|nr:CHASE2 domain-containing protein [Leptolyngbya sp. Cla-17]